MSEKTTTSIRRDDILLVRGAWVITTYGLESQDRAFSIPAAVLNDGIVPRGVV